MLTANRWWKSFLNTLARHLLELSFLIWIGPLLQVSWLPLTDHKYISSESAQSWVHIGVCANWDAIRETFFCCHFLGTSNADTINCKRVLYCASVKVETRHQMPVSHQRWHLLLNLSAQHLVVPRCCRKQLMFKQYTDVLYVDSHHMAMIARRSCQTSYVNILEGMSQLNCSLLPSWPMICVHDTIVQWISSSLGGLIYSTVSPCMFSEDPIIRNSLWLGRSWWYHIPQVHTDCITRLCTDGVQ